MKSSKVATLDQTGALAQLPDGHLTMVVTRDGESGQEIAAQCTKDDGGQRLTLRTRKEDLEHVRKLKTIDNLQVLEQPDEIDEVFKQHFGKETMLEASKPRRD